MDDVIANFMNTSDLHLDLEKVNFHIPAFFGDDFAYTNAEYVFNYINALSKFLEKVSEEKFGVKMRI